MFDDYNGVHNNKLIKQYNLSTYVFSLGWCPLDITPTCEWHLMWVPLCITWACKLLCPPLNWNLMHWVLNP